MTSNASGVVGLVDRYRELIRTCPRKKAFLDWPGTSFVFAFVWFKPFIRLNSVRVSDFQPAVNANIRNPVGRPFKELEQIALREGEIWSREFIASDIGVEIADVEAGLVSHWSGYEKDARIQRIGNTLLDYIDSNNLIEPMDLSIYPFESLIIADILRDNGCKEAHFFPAGISNFDKDVCGFRPDDPAIEFGDIHGAYSSEPEESFFMHTGYNDFSIVIHGTESLRAQIERHPAMEGFFCNENTDEAWLDEPGKAIGKLKRITPPKSRVAFFQ